MDLTKKISYNIYLCEEFQSNNGAIQERLIPLGSNLNTSNQNIFEPIFTKKLDGANSLSFSIYAKYWDEEEKKMVTNPLVSLLHNESKIKLKFYPTTNSTQPEWHEFIIKKIEETSDETKISYTATDYYVNELSKSGYSLVFDTELENNLGDIEYLAQQILNGTDWKVSVDNSIIDEKKEILFWADGSSEEDEQKKFLFYSSTIGPTKYTEDGVTNEGYQVLVVNGHIEHSNGLITNGTIKFQQDEPVFEKTPSKYYGMAQVWSPEIIYDSRLEKYVTRYNDPLEREIVGYIDTTYETALGDNYITNGYSITSDSGWADVNGTNLQVFSLPLNWEDEVKGFGFKLPIQDGSATVFNSGFTDNLKKITPISSNKEYVVRLKFMDKDGNPYDLRDFDDKENNFGKINFKIQKYTYDDQGFKLIGDNLLNLGDFGDRLCGKFEKDYSFEELNTLEEKIGIFIEFSDLEFEELYLTEAEFFELKTDSDNNVILPTGKILNYDAEESTDVSSWTQIKSTLYLYDFDQEATNKEQIEYLFIGSEENGDQWYPYYTNEKHRSISAKESNRFNLLQTLAEQFEVWCVLDIHFGTDGTLEEKTVKFLKSIGKHKEVPTIKYGLNLKSIKRTLDSDKIATKLIVKNNNNEFATDGSCNIARANLNPTGENFLINFDYFLNRKKISQEILYNDLYESLIKVSILGDEVSKYFDQSQDWVGFYNGLKLLNRERDKKAIVQSELAQKLLEHESNYNFANDQSLEIMKQILELKADLYEQTEFSYDQFIDKEEGTEKYANDNSILALLRDIKIQNLNYNKYLNEAKKYKDGNLGLLPTTTKQFDNISTELKTIEEATKKIIDTFESKYGRFIQEASWTSEDYVDDQLYYLDAEATLQESAFPKITYTVDALDLGYNQEFEYFHYDLADVIMVEDTENFGWAPATGEAFKEEFVITELKINFDSPEKNTISTKNYRSAFQDLFQRFAATTQTLQFHQGDWDKTTKVVDGTQITSKALKDAFANNANTLVNSKNKTVEFGENGLIIENAIIPAERVRVTGGGIFLTKDGGTNWTAGVTATGINANSITTGTLNVDNVNLINGAHKAFRWDKHGLSAYKHNDNGIYSNQSFVRFDENGIYGVGSSSGFNQNDFDDLDKADDRHKYIQENSDFSLTEKGITIGKKEDSSYLRYDKDTGELEASFNKLNIVVGKESAKLQVGGRNLLLASDKARPSTSSSSFGSFQLTEPLLIGFYTLSMCVSCGSADFTTLRFRNHSVNSSKNLITFKVNTEKVNEKQIYSGTFYVDQDMIPTSSSNWCSVSANYTQGNRPDSQIYWIQLEKGNLATAWGLAPEEISTVADTNQKITEVNTKISIVNSGITMQVAQANTEWEITGYDIGAYGKTDPAYDNKPNREIFPPENFVSESDPYDEKEQWYTGKYFLDTSTGKLFRAVKRGTAIWWQDTTIEPLKKITDNLKSEILQNAKSIDAKVSDEQVGTFGWHLTADSFTLYSNKTNTSNENSVFVCDKDGLTVRAKTIKFETPSTTSQRDNYINASNPKLPIGTTNMLAKDHTIFKQNWQTDNEENWNNLKLYAANQQGLEGQDCVFEASNRTSFAQVLNISPGAYTLFVTYKGRGYARIQYSNGEGWKYDATRVLTLNSTSWETTYINFSSTQNFKQWRVAFFESAGNSLFIYHPQIVQGTVDSATYTDTDLDLYSRLEQNDRMISQTLGGLQSETFSQIQQTKDSITQSVYGVQGDPLYDYSYYGYGRPVDDDYNNLYPQAEEGQYYLDYSNGEIWRYGLTSDDVYEWVNTEEIQPLSDRSLLNQTRESMVASTYNPDNSGFGWELTPYGFYLNLYKSNAIDKQILTCNEGGLVLDGSGTFSGTIKADGGEIAGWKISSNKLITTKNSSGNLSFGEEGFIGLYTTFLQRDDNGSLDGKLENGTSATLIAGHADDSWRLVIGKNFGVNNKGELYANSVNLTGQITASAGSKIGGWNIVEGSGNEPDYLFSSVEVGTKVYGIGIKPPHGENSYCLAIGTMGNDWSKAEFKVTEQGTVYAKNLICQKDANTHMGLNNGTLTLVNNGSRCDFGVNEDGISFLKLGYYEITHDNDTNTTIIDMSQGNEGEVKIYATDHDYNTTKLLNVYWRQDVNGLYYLVGEE